MSEVVNRSGGRPASVTANAGSLVSGRLVAAAMGWLGTVLIVRHLSAADWGRFTFVFSFLGMMTIVTNAVNPRVMIRSLIDDEGDLAGSFVVLRCALGVLGYAVAMSFVYLANYPPEVVRATAVAGLVVVIATPSNAFDAVYQVNRTLLQVSIAGVLGQAVQLALIAALVLAHSSMVVLTAPAVASEVVALGWKLFRLPGARLTYRVRWSAWIGMIKLSVSLALGGALVTLYYSLDSVMLSKMDTFRSVGIYGISYKFALVIQFVPVAIVSAILPLLVKHWPEEPGPFWQVVRRSVNLFFATAALVLTEFLVFATPVISLLYGSRYAVGAGAARLVVGAECLAFFTRLAVAVYVSMDRNRLYPAAALTGLLINFLLNLWLIPRFSYRGAAWATLATEVVVVGMLWVPLVRAAGRRAVPAGALLRAGGCAAAAAAAALAGRVVLPWPVAAGLSVAVYVAGLHLVRVAGPGGLRALGDFEPAVTPGS